MASEEAAAAAPAKGGKKGLIIGVLMGIFALAAGASVPWVLGGNGHDTATPKKKEAPKPKQEALPFGDVVVNLGDEPRLNRFLRVKVLLAVEETDAHEITELLTKQKAFLKSWLIGYLSDQHVQDVTRKLGVNRIRREIREEFNAKLFPNGEEKILDILFDEFVVQ